MQKILLIGATLIGAVVLVATPVSVKWSGLPNISNIVLGIDQAQSRVGHPGTAVSVAGVNGDTGVMSDGNIGGGTRACLQLGGLRTRTDQNQTLNAVL